MNLADIDIESVERLKQERNRARLRVRESQRAVLVAAGWTVYLYTDPADGEPGTRGRERYARPGARQIRVYYETLEGWKATREDEELAERSKRLEYWDYDPHLSQLCEAYNEVRSQVLAARFARRSA